MVDQEEIDNWAIIIMTTFFTNQNETIFMREHDYYRDSKFILVFY